MRKPCRWITDPLPWESDVSNDDEVGLFSEEATTAGYEDAEGLKQGPDKLDLPPYLKTPIPILPIHRGLACQVEPDTCHYVGLTEWGL